MELLEALRWLGKAADVCVKPGRRQPPERSRRGGRPTLEGAGGVAGRLRLSIVQDQDLLVRKEDRTRVLLRQRLAGAEADGQKAAREAVIAEAEGRVLGLRRRRR